MKTYARIENFTPWGGDKATPTVMEIIPPLAYDADSPKGIDPPWKQGDEIPIERRYASALLDGTISIMVDVTDIDPQPACWWTYENGKFYPPIA